MNKLCECGCGGLAPIATITSTKKGWIKGQPIRYINGHNIKRLSEVEYIVGEPFKKCLKCGIKKQGFLSREEV